jgi:hypothetical protein
MFDRETPERWQGFLPNRPFREGSALERGAELQFAIWQNRVRFLVPTKQPLQVSNLHVVYRKRATDSGFAVSADLGGPRYAVEMEAWYDANANGTFDEADYEGGFDPLWTKDEDSACSRNVTMLRDVPMRPRDPPQDPVE